MIALLYRPASDEGIQAVVEYFRLETDHGALESISGLDEHVCNAVEFGKGLA